jgi:hypothetical protein
MRKIWNYKLNFDVFDPFFFVVLLKRLSTILHAQKAPLQSLASMKIGNMPDTEFCGCARSRERRIVAMSLYHVSQTRYCICGRNCNDPIPSESQLLAGVPSACMSTDFFASGPTTKIGHENNWAHTPKRSAQKSRKYLCTHSRVMVSHPCSSE